MKRNKFKVGEKVKYLFFSYYDMLKSEYTQPHLLEDASPEKDYIMLGGEYDVLKVEKNEYGVYLYKLLYKNDEYLSWAPEAMLKRKIDIKNCPFKIGNHVLFSPKSSKKDIEAVSGTSRDYKLGEEGRKYTVQKIINNYYIFLETEGIPFRNFPFRWDDFKLLK